MPFSAKDARLFTKKANTPSLRKLWAKIANKQRKKLGDAIAIKEANAVVKRRQKIL